LAGTADGEVLTARGIFTYVEMLRQNVAVMEPLSPSRERGFSLLMFSDVAIDLPPEKPVLLQFDNFLADSRFHSQIATPDAANPR
jgi:hypothetical protein